VLWQCVATQPQHYSPWRQGKSCGWTKLMVSTNKSYLLLLAYLRCVGDDLCNMLAALMIICLAVKLGDVPVTASTPASERFVMANECNSCLFEPKTYSSKLKPCLEIRSSCQICSWVFCVEISFFESRVRYQTFSKSLLCESQAPKYEQVQTYLLRQDWQKA